MSGQSEKTPPGWENHQHPDIIANRLTIQVLLFVLSQKDPATVATVLELLDGLPTRYWHQVDPAHREAVQLCLHDILEPFRDFSTPGEGDRRS